ncbi:MAG: DUF1080 domain-containing protein [Opitutaceae bacterium]|nr:DUF1080 domain-containing protein [Opitutaceae bacterium]
MSTTASRAFRPSVRLPLLALICAATFLGFPPSRAFGAENSASPLPPESRDPNWVNLLAGDSLALWENGAAATRAKTKEIGKLWSVKDGVLSLDKTAKGPGGQIVTKRSYYDFELRFDFKISHNGNSGVKYRTDANLLGLEYQILDDAHHRDAKNPTHRSASMYELVAAPDTKKHYPPGGEWNTGRIVAKGNRLEHWLNGEKVVSIEFGSDDWNTRLAKSKYRTIPGFAASAGSILLQDHGDSVSFRNIYIRELKP